MSGIGIGDIHFNRKNIDVIEESIDFLISTDYYKKSSFLVFQGDIYDTRRSVDVLVLNKSIEIFEKLRDKEIKIIMGNHDMYHRESKEVTALNIIEKMFDNIEVIKKDTLYEKDGICIYMVPFNSSLSEEKIKKADYILGHLEIYPFFPESEINVSVFKDKKVFMGHQHKFDPYNTPYMGSMFSTSYNEIDNQKHFLFMENKNAYCFFKNKADRLYLTLEFDGDRIKIPFLNKETDVSSLDKDFFNSKYSYLLKGDEKTLDTFFRILSEKDIAVKIKTALIEEDEDDSLEEIDEGFIEKITKERRSNIFEIFKEEIGDDELKKELLKEADMLE